METSYIEQEIIEATRVEAPQAIGSESGKALPWIIVLAAIAWGSYFQWGQPYIKALSPFYNQIAVVALAVATIFALGCGCHLLAIGGKSNRVVRRNLRGVVGSLDQFITESNVRIRQIETDLGRNLISLRPRTMDSLSTARRILRPLSMTVASARELVSSGTSVDLIDADELLSRKLIVVESAMDSLIGAEPVPPLSPDEWIPTISRLLDEVEQEIRDANADHSQRVA